MLRSLFAPTEIFVTTENHVCSVHYLLRPISLSRRRTTSALFIVCSDRDRCYDGEPQVLCSLFAMWSLSGRRTICALFIVCSEIVVKMENHKCSVHCLLRPRSLSRWRTTSALLTVCSEIVVKTENHKCSVFPYLRAPLPVII